MKTLPFTGPHTVTLNQWISCAPFEQLLQMKIVEAANGRAVLTMPFHENLAQGAGLMHGGALVSLADTAVVMAIKSILTPGTYFGTISLEAKFLYPVKQGIVIAKAEVEAEKDRSLNGRATIFIEDDRPVLEFSAVFKIAKAIS